MKPRVRQAELLASPRMHPVRGGVVRWGVERKRLPRGNPVEQPEALAEQPVKAAAPRAVQVQPADKRAQQARPVRLALPEERTLAHRDKWAVAQPAEVRTDSPVRMRIPLDPRMVPPALRVRRVVRPLKQAVAPQVPVERKAPIRKATAARRAVALRALPAR
jgi:hypothetical protein